MKKRINKLLTSLFVFFTVIFNKVYGGQFEPMYGVVKTEDEPLGNLMKKIILFALAIPIILSLGAISFCEKSKMLKKKKSVLILLLIVIIILCIYGLFYLLKDIYLY